MRWMVFIVLALIAVVLEVSLVNAMALHSLGGVRPSVTIVLATFVALNAPRQAALWACWLLGLVVDLCSPLPAGGASVEYLVGPHAVGYAFAGYLILQLRPMVFRRRVLTIAALSAVSFLAASLVVVFVYSVRQWYPAEALHWTDFRPLGELGRRLGIAVYSALIALPVGFLLVALVPWWGFHAAGPRVSGWR